MTNNHKSSFSFWKILVLALIAISFVFITFHVVGFILSLIFGFLGIALGLAFFVAKIAIVGVLVYFGSLFIATKAAKLGWLKSED